MNLRLRRKLGTHVSDVASLATTRESETHSQGNLESIQESSSIDLYSDTCSLAKSNMAQRCNTNVETNWEKDKMIKNPFDDPQGRMEFNDV